MRLSGLGPPLKHQQFLNRKNEKLEKLTRRREYNGTNRGGGNGEGDRHECLRELKRREPRGRGVEESGVR